VRWRAAQPAQLWVLTGTLGTRRNERCVRERSMEAESGRRSHLDFPLGGTRHAVGTEARVMAQPLHSDWAESASCVVHCVTHAAALGLSELLCTLSELRVHHKRIRTAAPAKCERMRS
jgi:hypothetical protein